MEKKKFRFLVILMSGIILLLGIKGAYYYGLEKSREKKDEWSNLGEFKGVMLISYEGNCCKSTERYLREYREKVENSIKDKKLQKEFTYIDITTVSEEGRNDIIKLMGDENIYDIPFVLIKNKIEKRVFQGEIDIEDFKQVLSEMINSD